MNYSTQEKDYILLIQDHDDIDFTYKNKIVDPLFRYVFIAIYHSQSHLMNLNLDFMKTVRAGSSVKHKYKSFKETIHLKNNQVVNYNCLKSFYKSKSFNLKLWCEYNNHN